MVAGTAPCGPDDVLDLGGHLHVLRIRHAMADDGGFEGDDRATVVQRLANLLGQGQPGVRDGHVWLQLGSLRVSSMSRGVRSRRTVASLATVSAAAAWP